MSDKVFITGGAGFVGCAVSRHLLDLGHEVALYDSFLNYVFPLDKIHLDNLMNRLATVENDVKVYRGSTENQDCMRRAIMDFKPNRIIHLAAMPLANLAVDHPEEAVQSIVMGTLNLLHIARDLPQLDRLVYVSSSMVYGDFPNRPVQEDDAKDPKEVYGSMKLSGELMIRAFSRLFGLQSTVIRPSAVYGPTDNNRRVLGIFLENALTGKPLIVKGRGHALDFTFVGDSAAGIASAALHEKAAGKAYNITRGRGRTIYDAAQIVAKLVPGTEVIEAPADPRMPVRGGLDVSLAKSEIGFNPQVDLEEGLAQYHAYLQDQRQRGVW
ncbi:MAG: NAD-dependent epimerase/dehydratase family protein [Magnetococcales bacterium]|nr:NAD-dependent epimerase/dehydratase family protein [Magnetococcales bacterium]